MNLAKHPASTVQILGAEKALFRALKTKKDTPKYGLIYHASLVGQSTPKNKGKVRSIAMFSLFFILTWDFIVISLVLVFLQFSQLCHLCTAYQVSVPLIGYIYSHS